MPIMKIFTGHCPLILIICSLVLSSCEFENPWMKEILNFKTVSFNTNGGGYIPSQDLIMDETVKRPPEPSKEGFIFSDWYTDNDTFELLWDFDAVPYGYMTLHAKWDMSVPAVKTFTVTFISGGGSEVSPITVESGKTIAKPADPIKTGYNIIFTGWYEQNRTNSFNFDAPITANITLYANWRPYELGDTGPGGGIIFYRSEAGFIMTDDFSIAHYLEVTPVDIGKFVWASPSNINTYIQGTAKEIGAGRNNTRLIIILGTNAPAAHVCFEYINVKNDWFLPSIDELGELSKNRDFIDNLNGFYWSSTQCDDDDVDDVDAAWLYEIWQHGDEIGNVARGDFKNCELPVRAVRAF
jgi:uncharacterized repeat protein (TIGR02543 family)